MLADLLSGRRSVLGLLQMRSNLLLAELAPALGYDFLILDGEHGVFSDGDFARNLQVISRTKLSTMVRLASHSAEDLYKFVDLGADAIVVPHVSTADDADALARIAGSRSAPLIVIIESAMGVENVEEILCVDGVEGALVGPNDLTADLGCLGAYDHPSYLDALSRIEKAAAKAGKILGTIPHGNHSLKALLSRGYRLFILGTDEMLLGDAITAQVGAAKASIAPDPS